MEKKTAFVYESVWENGSEFEGGVSVRLFSKKENALQALKADAEQAKEMLAAHYDEDMIHADETETWIVIDANYYSDCWTGNVYENEIE